MARSIFELRIIFILDDFDDFYNQLCHYQTDALDEDKDSELEDLAKLKKMIEKSKKLNDKQKNKAIGKLFEIYSTFFDKKSDFDAVAPHIISPSELDYIRRINRGEIVLPTKMDLKNMRVNFKREMYSSSSGEVFTLDDGRASTFEQAFSIYKNNKFFYLDIYIPDVVNFLLQNRKLLNIAYDRGETLYVKDGKFDMIPNFGVINFLSFNTTDYKNAVHFSFKIDFRGNIVKQNVDMEAIKVKKHINKDLVNKMLQRGQTSEACYQLFLLKDLCRLFRGKDVSKYSNIKSNKTSDILALPSVLVNQYIALYGEDLIYLDGTDYVPYRTNYVHAATPIRRFVSDINLALFLNNMGCLRLCDEDVYYYLDNKNKIIDHLNEKKEIGNFIKRYPNYYSLKKDS